ncbi:MAG: biotin/lipoate A/B protein ligase family protein [Candidatus Omnitrophota bacterium]
MRLVDFSVDTPEETIAMDELLLVKAESGRLGETLRLWSAKDYFVVVGRAGRTSEDCFLDRCRACGIKIIRRISGGGTVLEGPGCFNYSVILSYDRDKMYRDVRDSYRRILGNISDIFKARGYGVDFFPVSDLALGGKKISGNAQARKRKYFLHHGTILFDFDLEKIPFLLRHPATEPEYRKGRAHRDFIANIPIPSEELKELIKCAFSPSEDVWEPDQEDLEELDALVLQKFSNAKWNYAF